MAVEREQKLEQQLKRKLEQKLDTLVNKKEKPKVLPSLKLKLHLLDLIKKQETLARENAILARKKQEALSAKNGKEILDAL